MLNRSGTMNEENDKEKIKVLYKAMAIIQENITSINKKNKHFNDTDDNDNTKKDLIENNQVQDDDIEISKVKNSMNSNELTEKVTKTIKCIICSKNFNYNSALHYHMKIHKGTKNFECKICDQTFYTNNALTRHKKIHSDDQKYVNCEICNEEFGQMSDLNRHKSSIYKKEKNLECHVCKNKI